MRIGDFLMARGLVSGEQIEDALRRQLTNGGRLGEILIRRGHLGRDDLDGLIRETPCAPGTVAGTGVSATGLRALMLKFMLAGEVDSASGLVAATKLPPPVIRELLRDALAAGLVELAGWLGQGSRAEPRYLPSVRGRVFARDALRHCRYLGPAPVALTAYQEQILKQRMATEEIDPGALDHCLDGLDVPSAVGRGLAPAIRSGGAILLHGAGGEPVGGIAAQISRLFAGAIHVPHAVEIEGQIMRVFDPDVHERTGEPPHGFDHRWTRVRRPDVRIGGDLTLDMLAPRLSAETKYHEAPMHLKALGGVFTMADFGAQAVAPQALMSRWAKPMESRIDVLKLKNGRRSFTVPFEELLIFSTTRPPEELIPPAILARIPHRIALGG